MPVPGHRRDLFRGAMPEGLVEEELDAEAGRRASVNAENAAENPCRFSVPSGKPTKSELENHFFSNR